MQDVIPPNQKRSIRDIPLPRSRRGNSDIKINNEEEFFQEKSFGKIDTKNIPPDTDYEENSYYDEEKPKKYFKKILFLFFSFFVIFSLLFFLRTKAEVTIMPKKETSNISGIFEIKEKNQNTDSNTLVYDKIFEIEKQSSITAESSGEEEVKQKASGIIKIYNEYSKENQNLVKNTRFEAKNGLIFRVANSVEIPGYKEENGKIIPGEEEAEIFADEEGEKYNLLKTKFTIPGFQKYPDRYQKIYAESTTDITGGFIGKKYIVSEEDKNSALEKLKQDIKEQMIKEVKNSDGNFFIIFDESKINYSNLVEENSENKVNLKISANVDAYAFNLKDFSKFFVKNLIVGSPEGEVIITNLDEIKFSLITIKPEDENLTNKLSLSVEGNMNFEWVIDTEVLAQELSGKNRTELRSILENKIAISKAEFELSPMWSKKFPRNPSKIKFTINK